MSGNGRALIVGSIGLDDIKTPFGEEKLILGGSAIYGAFAASVCARGVDVVGVAGDDLDAGVFDRLRKRGVDLGGVEIVKDGKTFRWGGEYIGDMDEAITHFTDLNTLMDFNPKIPDSYRDDDILFLANIDPELQLSVLDQVRKPKLTLLDTMNYWIINKRDVLVEALKRVDVVLLNAGEARLLFGTNSLALAGMELLKLGVKYAIIKKGEHGVVMFSESGFFATPAMPLEVVRDPTGAGDSFAGGLCGYLTRGGVNDQAIRQAIVVGSAVASFVVEDFSTRRVEGMSPTELEERCARLINAMNVDAVALGAGI